MAMFPGKTAYAVKTNGEQIVLKALVEAGVTAFDVASPGEFAAVRAVSPDAEMLYMHPVKAQSDIRLALEKYGIRVIAIDHEDEITKLTRIVQGARHRSRRDHASSCASRPRATRPTSCRRNSAPGRPLRSNSPQRLNRTGYKVGICFHVGSQIEDPDTYERALASADWVRNRRRLRACRPRRRRRLPGRIRPRPEPQAGRRCRRSARSCRGCRATSSEWQFRPTCRWSPSRAG